MTYLEVKLEGRAAQRADDPTRVISVDYGHVATAAALAKKAYSSEGATREVKQLADAIHSLAGVLTEIVAGLEHGRVGVVNYPTENAHLDR